MEAKAKPPREPEQIGAEIAAAREAAARHHLALLDADERAAAERVLAGGTARAGGRRLLRWAELTGRRVWIGDKRWGNPFRPWRDEGRRPTDAELAESHRRYREHVLANPDLRARLPGLRGKLLACACRPGVPCHGAVLIELIDDGGGA